MQLVLVKLRDRRQKAVDVQQVLTQHGCNIHLRIGLHETNDQTCSEEGIILLQVKPDAKAVKNLIADLKKLKSVSVKAVVI